MWGGVSGREEVRVRWFVEAFVDADFVEVDLEHVE